MTSNFPNRQERERETSREGKKTTKKTHIKSPLGHRLTFNASSELGFVSLRNNAACVCVCWSVFATWMVMVFHFVLMGDGRTDGSDGFYGPAKG